MSKISLSTMQSFLSKSISSLNQNKVRGLLAEVHFREHLANLGFGDRVSLGGWITRSDGADKFGSKTIVFFPQTINPDTSYPIGRKYPHPSLGLHTICSTFHQLGIKSYSCVPSITKDDYDNIEWNAIQLGLPTEQEYLPFPDCLKGFRKRERRYQFLRYKTDVSTIPVGSIPEEFTKEHIRVCFQNQWMSEMSDIDGIFWGHQYTYPIEIKEKTVANSSKLGDYFGLDIGPFVKLAFFAAKKGNMNSLFVVREIDHKEDRNLVNWWYITFDKLANYASWNPIGGGRGMTGSSTKVVAIPKTAFSILDLSELNSL